MKRKFAIVIFTCFVSALLLSSCSGRTMFNKYFGSKEGRYSHDDHSDANAKMDKVLEAIKNKDKDALKAMFSKKSVAESKDIDQNIVELFDYFQGDFESYNDWSAVNVFGGINDDGKGRNWKELHSTYDVKTNKQIYRFAIQDYVQDTADSNNVGIWSLYIIKMEDDTDPQLAYRGDDKDTPGINIAIKNILPKEDDSISAAPNDD